MSQLRLAGCAIGAALGTWGLPFLDAAFGQHAVRLALIWDLANIVAGASVLTQTPVSKASRLVCRIRPFLQAEKLLCVFLSIICVRAGPSQIADNLLRPQAAGPQHAQCSIGVAPQLPLAWGGNQAGGDAQCFDNAALPAVFGISYLVMMAGGSPPPALYEHADGGTFRGSWLGPRKQGLGVYAYPSGGQYQGMWQNNLKEGFGVYTFPKVGFLSSPEDSPELIWKACHSL